MKLEWKLFLIGWLILIINWVAFSMKYNDNYIFTLFNVIGVGISISGCIVGLFKEYRR